MLLMCLLFNVEIDKAIKILIYYYHATLTRVQTKKLSSPLSLVFSIRLEVRPANRKSTLLSSTIIKKTSYTFGTDSLSYTNQKSVFWPTLTPLSGGRGGESVKARTNVRNLTSFRTVA